MLRDRGFPGSAVQLRRYVRTVRPTPPAEVYLRLDTLRGEQAQVDWANFGPIQIGRARRAPAADPRRHRPRRADRAHWAVHTATSGTVDRSRRTQVGRALHHLGIAASAFVPLQGVDLEQILCVEEERVVSRDNVVVSDGLSLQLSKQPGRRTCAGLSVLIRRHLNGHHTECLRQHQFLAVPTGS